MTQILKSLSFTDVQAPANPNTSKGKGKARAKFAAAVANQLDAVNAYLAGAVIYTVEKPRYVKQADGTRKRQAVEAEVRPWWFVTAGQYYVAPRYANKLLEIGGKGKTSISAGSDLGGVREVLLKLRDAVDAGELDKLLEATASAVRERLAKNG